MDLIDQEDMGRFLLRLLVAGLMLFHGVGKVMGYPESMGFIQSALSGFSLPAVVAYGVFLGEVIGPIMVILGVFSRVGGLLIFANMIVAIALAHAGQVLAITDHGTYALELQAFYLFGGLAIALLGSGRMALRMD